MTHPIEGLVLVDDGSRWLRMAQPLSIIEARQPGDVRAAMRELQFQVRARRCHALGFLRYEAGEAFGLAVAPDSPSGPSLPLVWFALFDDASTEIVDPPTATTPYELGPLEPSVGRDAFRAGFARIREHLAAGDTYQVNYTFRLRGTFRGDPASLFADLAHTQRGRYAAFIRTDGYAICSASPELFFSYDGARLVARPMKGTAARGRTLAEDAVRARQLRASAKEQAENVMVVDMVRNDLGRVAEVGSVDVPSLFSLESYPNVWQLTSTVTARAETSLDEIVAALFPSASVTGAPKVRTMELIAELEGQPRGIYTGSMGYLAPDGRAQFTVAIRTAVVDCHNGTLEFGVGSGIVWDSDAAQEYDECLLKGSILGRRPMPFQILETMRWTPAEGTHLLERHLARLRGSAEYFNFACDLEEIRAALDRALEAAAGPLRLRLLLSANGVVTVERTALEHHESALHVRLAAHPVDTSDLFLFHKTTNRAVYERARRPDCDDVILWNAAREITETTIANLVIEIDGQLVTPPVTCGLLPGTFRAELLASNTVVEGTVTLDALPAATAIWLVSSLRGWRRAVLVAG